MKYRRYKVSLVGFEEPDSPARRPRRPTLAALPRLSWQRWIALACVLLAVVLLAVRFA